MKYFVLINFLFLFFTGCTNKLPIPGSDNIESILIIPHKATNQTKKPFGFKYTFTLKTEDGMEKFIEFYPRENKQYLMFDSLSPGTYKFEGRNDCLAVRGRTKNNCRLRKTKPIKFTLSSNSITILKNGFRVRQSWKKNMNSISAKFTSVPKIKIQQIIEELKTLENYEKWTVVESNQ
jgi:hypothetical protein